MTAAAQGHLFIRTDEIQDSDSWCTAPEVMDIAHGLWPDGIDLDPCANRWSIALGFVRARKAWTKADDCMAQPRWPGNTCWLQPPYGRDGAPIVADWARRWDAGEIGSETLALVRLDTSTDAWAMLERRASSLVLFNRRLAHYEAGIRKEGSNFCSAMLLCTRYRSPSLRHDALTEAVGDFGWVYR